MCRPQKVERFTYCFLSSFHRATIFENLVSAIILTDFRLYSSKIGIAEFLRFDFLQCSPLRFPEFNGEWEKCTIKDYGEVVTGNTPPTSNSEYYDNGSYLWASPADLGISKNITETKTKLSLSGFRKTRNIPKGSVLITCIGSTIGKMGWQLKPCPQTNKLILL